MPRNVLCDGLARIVSLAVCFAAAGLGSYWLLPALSTSYPTIQKPPRTLPDWVFGLVWTVLWTI
jgi:tryptophan-rich sensory protein